MIGFSQAFTRMLDLLNRAAPSDISVLLQGESGTGKELAAEYLHQHSHRAHKPFVIVECSGLNETLFESELFGHEKGAFTGALNRKPGLIEEAHGGTLFLDEVGDIPLSMQVKLLRLIETGSFRSVGSVVEKKADFRLILASHKNLGEMVDAGLFRKDLYYRISPYPVHLPSLSERQEDVPLIAEAIIEELDETRSKYLSKRARNWLVKQSYPGNIRQLRNTLERALLLCDGDEIDVRHLTIGTPGSDAPAPQLKSLEEVEREYLRSVLAHHDGDNKSLAKALGISERTLYRKLGRV